MPPEVLEILDQLAEQNDTAGSAAETGNPFDGGPPGPDDIYLRYHQLKPKGIPY